ncbi:MAG: hypothetical protein ACI9EW_001876 [Cellvibrionaceae bacterium]
MPFDKLRARKSCLSNQLRNIWLKRLSKGGLFYLQDLRKKVWKTLTEPVEAKVCQAIALRQAQGA